MKTAISLAAVILACGLAGTTAQAAVIYQSATGVDVNGQFTPDLTAVATPSFTILATFNPTAGSGGGVVVDELGQFTPDTGWHDSQIEVEANGNVFASVWAYKSYGGPVGIIDLGTANFGADNTVSFSYDDATGEFTANLNGVVTSANYGVGARATPIANGYAQIYGFGVGDTTNLGNGQSFVGTIDNVIISNTAAVPEPGTWAMMLVGLGMIGFAARRRRNVSVTYA